MIDLLKSLFCKKEEPVCYIGESCTHADSGYIRISSSRILYISGGIFALPPGFGVRVVTV